MSLNLQRLWLTHYHHSPEPPWEMEEGRVILFSLCWNIHKAKSVIFETCVNMGRYQHLLLDISNALCSRGWARKPSTLFFQHRDPNCSREYERLAVGFHINNRSRLTWSCCHWHFSFCTSLWSHDNKTVREKMHIVYKAHPFLYCRQPLSSIVFLLKILTLTLESTVFPGNKGGGRALAVQPWWKQPIQSCVFLTPSALLRHKG